MLNMIVILSLPGIEINSSPGRPKKHILIGQNACKRHQTTEYDGETEDPWFKVQIELKEGLPSNVGNL